MKITIKNKLLLYFTTVILMIVIIQVIFNMFFANGLYKMYKQQCIEDAFDEISETYNGDMDSIETIVSNMEEIHSVQISITCEDEIIYMTYQNTDYDQQRIEQPLYMSDDGEHEMLGVSETFFYGGEEIYVEMVTHVASVENTATLFTNANIVIGIIIFIFGFFFSVRISKSITKPIEKVEWVSRKLANLEFDEFVSENNSTREVDSLASSINRMSKELKSKIEDLNQANEILQQDVERQVQLEQMRREFIANVSHEMKTPLAILQFYCENLKNDVEGIDKTYYYDTIIEETKRMDEMVKLMLELSSLENGLSKMNLRETNLSEVVEESVAKLQPLLLKFQIITEIQDNLVVRADGKYLDHAIKNYINNAVSHTQEGKTIRISLKVEQSFAKLCVYNEGEHIDEAQIERIWESFYKLDQSRTREENTNVGLGLYIVQSIIERHEGTYGVSNLDDGVEFHFGLPLIS